ncbi:unnamed protein product [Clonostachys solani]|uniref:CFEM domain-containing protein n=1 Tax=Clonostachys solani TaxID=160281 RepID=A0A9N9W5Z8_9HYPO|nr:unnamed protein product [Clonostachys solani]
MHLEQKRLMLQLPTVLLPLLFSSLLFPSSTSAASYNLPSCYLECGRNLTGSLACDLSTGTDCDCTSSSFLDALGCCIVENCWTSHRSAQFRIPCQNGYVDAACPANVDVENSSTGSATGTATKMTVQALDIVTSTTLSTSTSSSSSQAGTVQVQTNTNTATGATATADSSNDSGSDDKSGVIGLGVGLGLGIPALLLAIFLVAYYYRKTKKAELESERSSRSRTRVGGPKSGRPSSPSTLVGSAAQPTTEKGSVTHRKNSVNARSARAGRDTALMSELPG